MNVIDLEILIPASPDFIWRFMGDLALNPRWYEDVVSVSFLSTQREGRGTRWRHSTVKGSDIIVEVSAWYDTLGYEYRIVDGTTYSDNQGRIRLHEVTDGTLVRWTFQYELSGVLGGIRNAMRLKRSTTNHIQDSLRNLHQLILEESGGISTHQAKASMQDAPDVSQRSSYQPRHPSAFHEGADVDDDTSLSERLPLSYDLELEPAPMPPVAGSDTKPNPVVLGADDQVNPVAEPEPVLDDTQPVEVETLLAEIPPPAIPDPEPAEPEPEPEPLRSLIERAPEETLPEPEPAPPRVKPRTTDDASHLSVFEIFGLQKPSEARAQAEPVDESFGEAPAEVKSTDERLPPAVEAESSGPVDDWAPQKQVAQADLGSANSTPIAGWRRSLRRKKAPIRSHR